VLDEGIVVSGDAIPGIRRDFGELPDDTRFQARPSLPPRNRLRKLLVWVAR
jgi:hypothetical protein